MSKGTRYTDEFKQEVVSQISVSRFLGEVHGMCKITPSKDYTSHTIRF